MTLLFCNIGWMERYQGVSADDKIKGGGEYVTLNNTGHEVCNFAPHRGQFYGYVQSVGAGIDIDRLGAEDDAESVDNISVVWTAKRPGVGTVVVGWYRNATVHDVYQKFDNPPSAQKTNGIDSYLITAKASDATLLPVDARTIRVPRGMVGGMGNSNVWYIDAPQAKKFRSEIEALLRTGSVPATAKSKSKAKPDQARKVLVEKSAVTTCWKHYEGLNYQVTSVEKDNVGWDLEATLDKIKLRIEVKGLSGKGRQIELTPKEYTAFLAHAADYRLAVVSNALDEPVLSIARFSDGLKQWVIEDDDKGIVHPEAHTGAIVRFT